MGGTLRLDCERIKRERRKERRGASERKHDDEIKRKIPGLSLWPREPSAKGGKSTRRKKKSIPSRKRGKTMERPIVS